jgi:hypothetical protein
MKKIRSVLAFITVFLLATVAHATTVERLELGKLVKKANKIVVGKVRGSRTYWSDNGKLILTDYTIDVEETIKGRASRTVEVTTIGGQIGDLTLHVAGMPSFSKDENAVVFVEDGQTYSTVVGLAQGKFTVKNGEVSNNVSDLEFPDGASAKPAKMPLSTFKRQIKTFLDR